ncbi:MAG: Flp pilus assembly complex ATPase component TadA [Acidimicrobiales bacterium]|nr:Flp pilus assembly complex ATPase component TadA [Acidimicrobiales bacterium]HRW37572.1 ATPase, T2SS/T4P/T4SS family [Aquihabitans sp.]
MALRRPKQQRGAGLVAADGEGPAALPDEGAIAVADATEAIAVPVASIPTIDGLPTPTGLLGEILVEQGAITDAALEEALVRQQESRERLGTVLVEAELITPEQLTAALAVQYGLKVVAVAKAALDPAVVRVLPEELARELHAVPLSKAGAAVAVAVADPARPGIFEEIVGQTDETIAFSVGLPEAVDAAIERAYHTSAAVSDAVKVFEARASERAPTATVAVADVDANAPVVQVVNTILTQAVRDRASDVHIEPMGDRVRVRNRIDGALHEVLSLPQGMAQALVSRIKIMADMNIVDRRRPQDGQIETVIDGNELDIRVSTTSTQYGEKTVLRVLDKARALYDLSTLGMPPETEEMYADLIRSPYGMVVCAGPTGSGKTTTLYATLMAINSDEINVMTVEDPVEYTFPTINQISIHEQAGVTFSAGLRAILRQDPDAILVGEIRDVETARIAIQAALTGHFVLSTIHATDATSALHRFLDMGIESFLLASSMLAVVGQRLIRRNCTECVGPYEPSAEDQAFYERAGGKPKDTFMKGHGCEACSGTGYSGRIGVYEVLQVTDEMRDLVVRNAPVDEIRKLAIDQGMVPLRDQALRLVAEDVTTIAEVIRTIYIL